jgi:hypothetical protein
MRESKSLALPLGYTPKRALTLVTLSSSQ